MVAAGFTTAHEVNKYEAWTQQAPTGLVAVLTVGALQVALCYTDDSTDQAWLVAKVSTMSAAPLKALLTKHLATTLNLDAHGRSAFTVKPVPISTAPWAVD